MAVVGIWALGKADWNLNITSVSQLVHAAIVPFPNPNAFIVSLISVCCIGGHRSEPGRRNRIRL